MLSFLLFYHWGTRELESHELVPLTVVHLLLDIGPSGNNLPNWFEDFTQECNIIKFVFRKAQSGVRGKKNWGGMRDQ